MTKSDIQVITAVITIPLIGFYYWLFNPPQCPDNFEPGPGDHCIVGANIGGFPLFIFLSIATPVLIYKLLEYFSTKKK